MFPTPCDWLLRQNESLRFPNTLPVLDKLVGGLHPGQVIELCGPSGVGKSKVCWHLIKDCLRSGKNAFLVSSRNVLAQESSSILNSKNFFLNYVSDVYSLLLTLSALDSMEANLVVVDGVQSLLQAVLGSANFRGHTLLSEVRGAFSRLAVKSLVVYTNGLVSLGDGNHGPALGRAWEVVPSVRVMVLPDPASGKRLMWRDRSLTAELRVSENGVEIV